jgi:hypothetical protein
MEDPKSVSDESKRMSDAVNLAMSLGGAGKWMAFRLQTGSTDHAIYSSRADAVAHCSMPSLFCFLQVAPGGMQPREADAYLSYFRQLYSAGGRFNDSDFRMPLMPLTGADKRRQIDVLVKGI